MIVNFEFSPVLDSIALAPAFNPMATETKADAFPSRFKIDVWEVIDPFVHREGGLSVTTGVVLTHLKNAMAGGGPIPIDFL